MSREGRDSRNEVEWMETRVGVGRRPAGVAEAPDTQARTQDEVEKLRAENKKLRTSLERMSGGRARPADGAGRSARTPTLEEVERDHIVRVLLDCHWRVKGPQAAAELLGLNPGTLYSRMKKLGISRDDV